MKTWILLLVLICSCCGTPQPRAEQVWEIDGRTYSAQSVIAGEDWGRPRISGWNGTSQVWDIRDFKTARRIR